MPRIPGKVAVQVHRLGHAPRDDDGEVDFTDDSSLLCSVLGEPSWTLDEVREAVILQIKEGFCLYSLRFGEESLGFVQDEAVAGPRTLRGLGLEGESAVHLEAVVLPSVKPGLYDCSWSEHFCDSDEADWTSVTYTCRVEISANLNFRIDQFASQSTDATMYATGRIEYGNVFVFPDTNMPSHFIRSDENGNLYLSTSCCRSSTDELDLIERDPANLPAVEATFFQKTSWAMPGLLPPPIIEAPVVLTVDEELALVEQELAAGDHAAALARLDRVQGMAK